MSITNTAGKTFSVDGKNFTQTITVPSNASVRREITLPAAKTGTLSTRSDDDTGILTMTAGHGITNGQLLDIYWTDLGIRKHRRNMLVGTVVTNSVPIDGGSGDILPAGSTAITAQVPSLLDFPIPVGDDLQILVVTATGPATVVYTTDGATETYADTVQQVGQVKDWYINSGRVNPLAGVAIVSCLVSQGDSTGEKVVKINAGVN